MSDPAITESSDVKNEPTLSVVVVTRDDARTLRPILAALGRQTIAAELEIVVVAPDRASGTPRREYVEAFHGSRVIDTKPISNRGRAAASGVRAARAPLIALTENHCLPAADWAERTVRAHAEGSWVAVGPSVTNANPESTISRLLFAAGYGMYPPGGAPELRDELPLHNSSITASALAMLDPDLPDLLADERLLFRALRARGFELRFDPRCIKHHINEATFTLLTGLAYTSGRRYGESRARSWSLFRRIGYLVATPLLAIPIAANLWRRLAPDRGRGARGSPIAAITALYAALHALGEGVSYALGTAPEEYPFIENEEFYIRERLGRFAVSDPAIREVLAELDRDFPTVEHRKA